MVAPRGFQVEHIRNQNCCCKSERLSLWKELILDAIGKMSEETVNVNPDGRTTFEGGAGGESTMPPMDDAGETFDGTAVVIEGTDPLLYLFLVALVLGLLFFVYRRRSQSDDDEFFSSMDGEKVSIAF
jgi:hypothetical protein